MEHSEVLQEYVSGKLNRFGYATGPGPLARRPVPLSVSGKLNKRHDGVKGQGMNLAAGALRPSFTVCVGTRTPRNAGLPGGTGVPRDACRAGLASGVCFVHEVTRRARRGNAMALTQLL